MDWEKTDCELFSVWGCPAQARIFNPLMGKLDPKTVSCHFNGYPDKSKEYRFYCPNQVTKFVETRHAVFLESDMMRGSMTPREIILEESREFFPIPIIKEPVFPVSADVAPPVEGTVSTTSAEIPVTRSDVTPDDVIDENDQQPQIDDEVPNNEPLRRSQRHGYSQRPRYDGPAQN